VGVDGTGNQFMGFVTGAFPHNNYPDLDQDWRGIKRWYAVMHHFGADGNHLRTEAWCAGTSADDFEVGEAAFQRLDQMFGAIVRPVQRPIRVRPFSYSDGVYLFELFPEQDPDESGRTAYVWLQPNDVMFHNPWDGEYST